MDFLKDILSSLISNFIWVLLVFVFFYFWNRQKKRQIARCLEAYLIFLIKNVGLIRYSIYPYIYLLELKTIQGNMLGILLEHISQICGSILEQTQESLALIESRKLQEKVLALYHRIVIFQTHIAESISIANIIVGNPTELTEPPRQEEEIARCHRFVVDFHQEVQNLYNAFSPSSQNNIPKEILDIMDQKTPLQKNFEEKQKV